MQTKKSVRFVTLASTIFDSPLGDRGKFFENMEATAALL